MPSTPSAPPAALFDLTGEVALVTGGSRGIGRAIALGLAGAGADVIVASRNLDSCELVAGEIEELGRRALAIACNVGDWDQVDALVDRAYASFSRVDILVNNAGASPIYPSVEDVSKDLFDKVIGINLRGPFRLMARIGSRMARGGGGSIINVTSHSAEHPDETMIPYAAAKAGLNSMTIGCAHAFGPTVRVNAIQPGMFLTDISRSWPEEDQREWAATYALKRGAQPDEIVGTALYLASRTASSYTTGAILRVDGGNT